MRQHLVRLEQLLLPGNRKHRTHRAMELRIEHVVDALPQLRIQHQLGIKPRRSKVNLPQRELNVPEQVDKQWKLSRHCLQPLKRIRLGEILLYRERSEE